MGYRDFTDLIDRVFLVWFALEAAGPVDGGTADRLEAVVGHLTALRESFGWDGVPAQYLR